MSFRIPLSNYVSVDLGYAYLDHDVSNLNENTLNTRHSGSIFFTHEGSRWKHSLGYIGHDSLSNASLDRFILNVGRGITFGKTEAEIYLTYTHQPSSIRYTEEAVSVSNEFIYDNDDRVGIKMDVRF